MSERGKNLSQKNGYAKLGKYDHGGKKPGSREEKLSGYVVVVVCS